MLFETISNWSTNLIVGLFSVFEFVNLPTDAISVLYTIMCYGVWVVGSDILLLVFSTIFGWITFKATVGLAIWLYKLLPLT